MTELGRDLPSDAAAMARELMIRLDGRIRNLDWPTDAERRVAKPEEPIEPQDLERAARTGSATAEGMGLIYFELLRAFDLHPKVALVADRELRLFSPHIPSIHQFTHQLYGIETPEGTFWVDPAQRNGAPGLVHPKFQGTTAMILDFDAQSAGPRAITLQPASMNLQEWRYRVSPEEEGDRFQLEAEFKGYPDSMQRQRFLGLATAEQAHLLREDLETRLGATAELTRCEVRHVEDPRQSLRFQAEGRMERPEAGRRVITPFPGLPLALPIPEVLPARRLDPILLNYARIQRSECRIKVPPSWRLAALEPFERRNGVGRVSWGPSDGGTVVEGERVLTLQVEVTGAFLGPEKYEELKAFLGWIQEAMGRRVLLNRLP